MVCLLTSNLSPRYRQIYLVLIVLTYTGFFQFVVSSAERTHLRVRARGRLHPVVTSRRLPATISLCTWPGNA